MKQLGSVRDSEESTMNFKAISATGLAVFLLGSVPMTTAAVMHYGLMDAAIVNADPVGPKDPPGPKEPNPSEDNNNAQGSENGKGHQEGHPGHENSKGHENHKGFGHGHKEASPS
jgi:hypothetical protein